MRKRLTQEMQALIVFLRFGSMSTDEKTWLSVSEVFKRTGIKPSTQLEVFDRWRRRGFVIYNEKPKGRKRALT